MRPRRLIIAPMAFALAVLAGQGPLAADAVDIGEADLALVNAILAERAETAAEPTIAGLRAGRRDDLGRASLCGWAELTGRSALLRRFVIVMAPVGGEVEETWVEGTEYGFLSTWRRYCPMTEVVRQ